MEKLDIAYEILDYNSYHKRLNDLLEEPKKNPVAKHLPIGYSSCGFSIDHYSIGNGPLHIVFLGGAHGNEIIGVDYITQLMKNISEGNGIFQNFDPNQFTIDFIPCQNPEGFYTTTYALASTLKGKSSEEIEKFSKEYWQAYREDDINVMGINYILREFCKQFSLTDLTDDLITLCWQYFHNKEITINGITAFLIKFFNFDEKEIKNFVTEKWNEKLAGKDKVPSYKHHQKMFDKLTLDCIPPQDKAHALLKEKLQEIYSKEKFPIGTLANFFANADGINLNDNNESYFENIKTQIRQKGLVFASLRDNNLTKNYPGPAGMPNISYESKFEYAPENKALFEFLARQNEKEENFAFINCHGTGGMFYLYPIFEDDMEKAHTEGVTRNFSFYINNRIATEYTKAIGQVYEDKTGTNSPYRTMGHPEKVTGVGDLLRKEYLASFLLELSKMGGNPIAPYGDKEGNYKITMESNMEATMKMLETILSLEHLYSTTYHMSYDEYGKVRYDVKSRTR